MVRWSELPDNIDEDRIHDQTESKPEQEAQPAAEAKARRSTPDFRSKTEGRWWRKLKSADGISRRYYEPMSFRIGPKRHYRPDFVLVRKDGGVEVQEVKGSYVYDRALVKPSAAAALYPFFDWVVVAQDGKGGVWSLEWVMPNRAQKGLTVASNLTLKDTTNDDE